MARYTKYGDMADELQRRQRRVDFQLVRLFSRMQWERDKPDDAGNVEWLDDHRGKK